MRGRRCRWERTFPRGNEFGRERNLPQRLKPRFRGRLLGGTEGPPLPVDAQRSVGAMEE